MANPSWLVSRPSYLLWRAGLGVFGIVAVLTSALTVLSPGTLRG